MSKLSNRDIKDILKGHKYGVSTYTLAKKMGVSPSCINYHLQRNGVTLKKRSGKKEETLVANLEKENGKRVEVMPINHPFDLLIDNKKVDVKSAVKSAIPYSKRYVFQLQDLTQRKIAKDLKRSADMYYLVLKDVGEIYTLPTDKVDCIATLSLRLPIEKSKYYRFMEKVEINSHPTTSKEGQK